MPDIGKKYDYDFLYTLEVVDPEGEPVGITMKIRSASSEVAKEVQRRHNDKNVERAMKNKLVKSETLEQQNLERAYSYIAEWDWGENDYNGVKPDLSHKQSVMEILKREDWIYKQVVEAANEVSNFSTNSGTS